MECTDHVFTRGIIQIFRTPEGNNIKGKACTFAGNKKKLELDKPSLSLSLSFSLSFSWVTTGTHDA